MNEAFDKKMHGRLVVSCASLKGNIENDGNDIDKDNMDNDSNDSDTTKTTTKKTTASITIGIKN